ncbi:uncharacterized protein MONBRDRAFT_5681 [Monosiga brevicollis MX1]|uniref:Uncharacterized protein n=1 Tax=Monosiga brevicollis TaxID=81824 RepID=A9US52_MONBE|nr:uncharacterized protein MONBRDRAFT_5681 [Monosiga brevicollis MX1]EDQ92041.1 predicted protein [Monosiga brevicollis MX1]|eukprot:XP_001743327.1 hypothetical protein [Monosiga brevicollis MX1]
MSHLEALAPELGVFGTVANNEPSYLARVWPAQEILSEPWFCLPETDDFHTLSALDLAEQSASDLGQSYHQEASPDTSDWLDDMISGLCSPISKRGDSPVTMAKTCPRTAKRPPSPCWVGVPLAAFGGMKSDLDAASPTPLPRLRVQICTAPSTAATSKVPATSQPLPRNIGVAAQLFTPNLSCHGIPAQPVSAGKGYQEIDACSSNWEFLSFWQEGRASMPMGYPN